MLKALELSTEKEILIFAGYWNEGTINLLRSQGRENKLICPVCKEPVQVRAAKKNRWHFAHKSLNNCPLKHESQMILEAKILLYSWLKTKLGNQVTIEKYLPGMSLLRPLDCYVELPSGIKIGYWILEKGLRDRWKLEQIFSEVDITLVWVPLLDMLKIDTEDQTAVHLTPTERDILFSSNYNQLYSSFDTAITYLNVSKKNAVTLRGLHCVHLPQKYCFDFKLTEDLSSMLFNPLTGEFVHPAEPINLEKCRKEREEHKQRAILEEQKINADKLKRQRADLANRRNHIPKASPSIPSGYNNRKSTQSSVKPIDPVMGSCDYFSKSYPCRECGIVASDYTSLDLASKTCLCRECLKQNRIKMMGI